MSLTEQAERAGINQQAMGKLVKEMESLGYVKRTVDEADKRAKIIELTDHGKNFFNESFEVVDEITQEWSTAMGSEEFSSLQHSLHQGVRGLKLRYLPESWDGEI